MIEVRIHGRGGQGNVVAAYLLATTAIGEGKFSQAFPAFGAERRGAPVTAFVRICMHKLQRRNQILHPGFLIIQDQALLHVPEVIDGLLPGGGILVNSTLPPEELAIQEGFNVVTIPASTLANEHLGRAVPNTALLSAFLTLTDLLPQASLINALSQRFHNDILQRNINLVKQAAQSVQPGLWKELKHATGT